MEQHLVKNTTQKEVTVQWGGLNYYFAPDETKYFDKGIAEAMIEQSSVLKLDEVQEIMPTGVDEVPHSEPAAVTEPKVELQKETVKHKKKR